MSRAGTILESAPGNNISRGISPQVRYWDPDVESPEDGAESDSSGNEEEGSLQPPEHQAIPLPSSLTKLSTVRILEVAKQQLKLEIGLANETLHKLRLAVGEKSFLYRNKVRPANNYAKRNRAYADIRNLDRSMNHNADVYHACRAAMEALNADQRTLDRFQVLKREDLKTDTAVMDPNARGQRNKRMSWIWESHDPTQQSPNWMTECMLLPICRPPLF